LTIHEADIYPERQDLDPKDFRERNAARAVVLDGENRVALLHATTYNYHKLPGGGVEDGEDMALALQRELVEEIGCEADVVADVGEIIEYRDEWGLRQTSHCYLARQKGVKRPPSFTQSEIDEGFEIVWAHDIAAAISLLEQDLPQNYDGLFIQRRDLTLLRAAQALL
jgi:8-oxo-dGTP diphosphatase